MDTTEYKNHIIKEYDRLNPRTVKDEYKYAVMFGNDVKECGKWLGEDGLNFFRNWIDKHGKEWCTESTSIWISGGNNDIGHSIPHPIHFNEGMQVRNFILGSEYGTEYDFEVRENHWHELIEKVLDNI